MSWMVTMLMTGASAHAADGPVDVAALFARPATETPRFAEPPPDAPMPALPNEQRALPSAPAPVAKSDKHRSRAMLLGALGAEVAAGALLGGAAVARTSYLDPGNEPGRGLYRTNRVLGHAGYVSAVAGGALVLGSVSLWEW